MCGSMRRMGAVQIINLWTDKLIFCILDVDIYGGGDSDGRLMNPRNILPARIVVSSISVS